MTAIRVVVADIGELFEAPPFDPLAARFERDSGIERALKQLEDRRRVDVSALEIALPQPVDPQQLKTAIAAYCASERAEQVRQLKLTRHHGRQALWIGVPVLAVCLGLSTLATARLGAQGFGALVSNSLIIAGWVAIWRPAELLLYDWWPYRNRIHLLDRLARLELRVTGGSGN